MNILITGDYAPVYGRLKKAVESGDYPTIFGDIRSIVKTSDLAITNFECAITNQGNEQPITKHGPNIAATANAMKALAWCGFNMITLANNHILDYGSEGLVNVLEQAAANGIATVGAGTDREKAAAIRYYEKDGVKAAIINCCENEFSIASSGSAGANPLDTISRFYDIREAKKSADKVIVIVHGGHEMYRLPSSRMQDTYRFFIDAGADVVVNHHQHCFSGYELYNGKPIFYGLGNFCFDLESPASNPAWNQGLMLSLCLDKDDISFKLIPYRQCLDKPAVEIVSDPAGILAKVDELGSIISQRALLEDYQNEYYEHCSKSIIGNFQPYSNKLLRAAYHRGFLPSFVRGRKAVAIANMINCEAHRDKVTYAFNKLINR